MLDKKTAEAYDQIYEALYIGLASATEAPHKEKINIALSALENLFPQTQEGKAWEEKFLQECDKRVAEIIRSCSRLRG